MPVVAQTTSLSYAGRGTGDQGSPTMLHAEVNRTPGEAPADTEIDVPTGLLANSHATTTAKVIAPPTVCPIALPITQAIVYCPAGLTDPIAGNPYRYSKDSTNIILIDSLVTTDQTHEGSLFTERVSDGQVTFFTRHQLPTQDRTKLMTVKIDLGAQVNTIPLSRYCMLFPHKLNKSRLSKTNALLPTAYTWISHDGLPKPFLGHFVADIKHASEPRSYPTCFYVFEDATPPQILLSYVTLERLGIIAFNVPNLTANSQVDNLHVPTSPDCSSTRKTTKKVTFHDPIVDTAPLHSSTPSQTSHQGMRKTASLKVSFSNISSINVAKCKSLPSTTTKSILRPTIVHCLCPKSALKAQSPQATFPCSLAQVQDIMALK